MGDVQLTNEEFEQALLELVRELPPDGAPDNVAARYAGLDELLGNLRGGVAPQQPAPQRAAGGAVLRNNLIWNDAGTRFMNSARSQRWVKRDSKLGRSTLRAFGQIPEGKSTSRRTYKPHGQVAVNGGLRRQEYRAQVQLTSMAQMANAIIEAYRIHGDDARRAVVWYENEDGQRVHRSVAGVTADAVLKDLLRLQRGAVGVSGSDVVHSDSYNLVLDTFYAGWVAQPGGGRARQSYQPTETKYFSLRDYRCAEGDCLLAVLRQVTELPIPVRNRAIRSYLNIPAGNVTLAHIDQLAEYFQVRVIVYAADVTVNERRFIDTMAQNKAVVDWSYNIVHTSENEYRKEVQVLLNDGHYSHIMKTKPPQFCPVTGDELEGTPLTEEQRRVRVVAQGRLWAGVRVRPKREDDDHRAQRGPQKRTMVLVYDFETVWDPNKHGEIMPYSVGWYGFDPAHPPADFAACQTEVSLSYGENCAEALVNHILAAPPHIKYLLVSFNGTNFDHYLLAKTACKLEVLRDAFFAKSGLLNVRIGRHSCFDLAKYCLGSLKRCCESFQTNPKKMDGFDHNLVQKQFLDGGRPGLESWLDAHREFANRYLATDVLSTADLFVKLSKALLQATNVDITKVTKLTLPSLAWYAFKQHTAKNEIEFPKTPKDEGTDLYLRKSITGGRTQNFTGKPRRIEQPMMIDVKSLYPTVMCGKNAEMFPPQCLYGRFPLGDPIATPCYVPGKIGFYNCNIVRQPEVKIWPRRVEGKPLDWEYNESFDSVLPQCGIELIRHHGGEVVVGAGLYYERSSSTLFTSFYEGLVAEKNRQDRLRVAKDPAYNPALRECVKLVLNSISGKFAQRNFKELCVVAKGATKQIAAERSQFEGGVAEWIPLFGETVMLCGQKKAGNVFKQRTAKPCQVAALIYDYARTYMYHLILSRYPTHYMDTDSALLSYDDYVRFKAENPTLNPIAKPQPELGDLEDEELCRYPTRTAILLAPKMYLVAAYNEDGTMAPLSRWKLKCKGVNLYRDKLIVANSPALTVPKGVAAMRDELVKLRTEHGVVLPALDEMDKDEIKEEWGRLALLKRHTTMVTDDDVNTVSLQAEPTRLFEQLLATGAANVLCGQICRWRVMPNGSYMQLCQRYLVKELGTSGPVLPEVDPTK